MEESLCVRCVRGVWFLVHYTHYVTTHITLLHITLLHTLRYYTPYVICIHMYYSAQMDRRNPLSVMHARLFIQTYTHQCYACIDMYYSAHMNKRKPLCAMHARLLIPVTTYALGSMYAYMTKRIYVWKNTSGCDACEAFHSDIHTSMLCVHRHVL